VDQRGALWDDPEPSPPATGCDTGDTDWRLSTGGGDSGRRGGLEEQTSV